LSELVVALGAYLAIIALVTLWSRLRTRTGDPVDYFIASRGLSGFVSAMTYAATTYSAFMMVGLVGLSYATGVGALVFELSYLVATVAILAIVGPKVWELSRRRGYVTPTQLLKDSLGSYWGTALAVAMNAVALIPYSAVQIVGPAAILSGISRGLLDVRASMTVVAAIVILTTLTAGLRSVAWTDAAQGFIMVVGALALTTWLISVTPSEAVSKLGDLGLLSPLNNFWTPRTLIAYTTPWIFFALTNPQVFQRLYLPKDRKSYLRMVLLFSVFGLAYTVMAVLIGLLARGLSELGALPIQVDVRSRATWNNVTPQILSYAHPALTVLTAISIIAAATSTVNSIVLTISSMVSYDTPIPEKLRLLAGKAVIVVITLIVYAFALTTPAFVVDLAVASSSLLLPLLPLYLFSIYGPRSRLSYLATVLLGFPLALVLATNQQIQPPIPKEVVILVLSFAIYLAAFVLEKFLPRSHLKSQH
jgi:SSS family solute:Na+ symporter